MPEKIAKLQIKAVKIERLASDFGIYGKKKTRALTAIY